MSWSILRHCQKVAAGISYSDSDTDDTITLSYLCEYDEENRLVQKLGLNRSGQETGDVITYQYDEGWRCYPDAADRGRWKQNR